MNCAHRSQEAKTVFKVEVRGKRGGNDCILNIAFCEEDEIRRHKAERPRERKQK